MVRTTLGAEVETSVTVEGSESVDIVVVTGSGTVAGGSSEEVILRAPAGVIYEILAVNLRVDAVSSTATDIHFVRLQSESKSVNVVQGNSDANTKILYQSSHFTKANQGQRPPDVAAQGPTVSGLRADSSAGFQFQYVNNSSQDHTDARRYKLWLRQIQVGET